MPVKRERKPPKSPQDSFQTILYDFITKNFTLVLGIAGIIVFLIVAYFFASLAPVNIKNLINVDPEILKDSIFGDHPHLFFCHRDAESGSPKGTKIDGDIFAPQIFKNLYQQRSSKYHFAVINCSQVLPSGKNIWERFKLKKEVQPTIFGTAPWTKVKQIASDHLKDIESLKKQVDSHLAAKAYPILQDKDLRKYCGYGGNKTVSTDLASQTCIVLFKGTRHTRSHADMEARLVQENPRLKIAIVDATKRRFSFENPAEISADLFALKVHAIRNGSHYLSMTNPVTWDYLSTFVAHAAGTPLYNYHGRASEPVSLLKLSSLVFKRKAKLAAEQEDTDEDSEELDDEDARPPPRRKEKAKRKSETNQPKKPSPEPVDNEEDDRSKEGRSRRRQKLKEEQQKKQKETDSTGPEADAERERERRERMDRQSRERLFDESDEHIVHEYEDDEDDEVIEL